MRNSVRRTVKRSLRGMAAAAAGVLAACGAGMEIPLPGPFGGDGDAVARDRPSGTQDRPSAAPVGDPSEGPRIGELASRRGFDSGECGLFLWTRTADPALVFFADSSRQTAAIQLDGDEVALRRVEVTGSRDGEQYGVQVFASANGDVTTRLTIDESEPIENGALVRTANLRVTDARGWSTVLSVGGIAACQP